MEGIHIPAYPMLGDRISPTMMRDLVGAVRRNVPIAGKGIRLQRTMGGVVISATPTGKHIGGEAQARPLFPYRCEWVEGGSDKEIPDSGYAFYLPIEGTLTKDGKRVEFAEASTEFGRDGVLGGSAAFKVYDGIGQGVVCALLGKGSSSEGSSWDYAKMVMLTDIPDDDPSAIWFPVCEIEEIEEGSGSEAKVTRHIQQYAWGAEALYGGGEEVEDLGPFRLGVGSDGIQCLMHCYYAHEQTIIFMENQPTDTSWAGQILWLENSEGTVEEGGVGHILSYGSLSDFNIKVADPTVECVPLYLFRESVYPLKVEVDFRNIPTFQAWGEYSY